jgi:hypothetical protein
LFISEKGILVSAQENDIKYTQDDRDRMVRVETKVEGIEKRIDRLEDKFDTYFTWGFGLVLGAVFALFGFIIWDRRTTIALVKREQDKVIDALRELGKTNEQVKEALKKVALW